MSNCFIAKWGRGCRGTFCSDIHSLEPITSKCPCKVLKTCLNHCRHCLDSLLPEGCLFVFAIAWNSGTFARFGTMDVQDLNKENGETAGTLQNSEGTDHCTHYSMAIQNHSKMLPFRQTQSSFCRGWRMQPTPPLSASNWYAVGLTKFQHSNACFSPSSVLAPSSFSRQSP